MIVKELKEICKLVSMSGLIDEFTILKDGHIVGVDIPKTAVVDLKYNIEIPKDICITNVKGVKEVLDKFSDDTNIEIVDDILNIVNGDKFYKIPLKNNEKPKFNLPTLTENDYQVIAEGIDHNIINELGKLRAQSLTDDLYYLYVINNELMMRVGDETAVHGGDFIGNTKKCTSNETMKLTMNVSECFKSISTTANINLFFGKLMMIECRTEKYNVRYYLAPRVD